MERVSKELVGNLLLHQVWVTRVVSSNVLRIAATSSCKSVRSFTTALPPKTLNSSVYTTPIRRGRAVVAVWNSFTFRDADSVASRDTIGSERVAAYALGLGPPDRAAHRQASPSRWLGAYEPTWQSPLPSMIGLRDPHDYYATVHTAPWAGVTLITPMGEDVTEGGRACGVLSQRIPRRANSLLAARRWSCWPGPRVRRSARWSRDGCVTATCSRPRCCRWTARAWRGR